MPVRVELRKDAGKFDRYGGPWVRRRQVAKILGPPDPMAVAALVDHRGNTLGHGLYSPESGIPLRLLTIGARPPEPGWLERRIGAALGARARLGLGARARLGLGEGSTTDGYREINSEGDGLPGLVVDRYANWRVVQVTTAPMAARVDAIAAALRAWGRADAVPTLVLAPESAAAREGFPAGVRCLDGEPPVRLDWSEHGRHFSAPAPPAQKTGAYHDQRANRVRFAELVAARPDRPVLDLGCHVGGFAIAAAQVADAPVVAVDRSELALASTRANAAANGVEVRTLAADMFGALDSDPALVGPFGAIVFDPPKIASDRRDLRRAIPAMARTLSILFSRLDEDGVIAVCSCSHHLGVAELDRAILEAGRPCTRVAVWGPGPDHPVWPGHAEGEYLRVAVYQRRS